jgi:hypothetical protein
MGTVQAASNKVLKNLVKRKMEDDTGIDQNAVAELVLEYLSHIFSGTVRPVVEDLSDYAYICYSKNYPGVESYTYEGFSEEVERGIFNEDTPPEFGFIKSFANLNWYNFLF